MPEPDNNAQRDKSKADEKSVPASAPEQKKLGISFSISHMNATDFVNAGSLFKQPLVSAYFTPNLSTTMGNVKITNSLLGSGTISSGQIINWPEGAAYTQKPEKERWLTSGTWEKRFDVGGGYAIKATASGVLAKEEKNDPKTKRVTFLNPEVKLDDETRFVGLGGIIGKNVTPDQAYVMVGYKGAQANLGIIEKKFGNQEFGMRTMLSYDLKLHEKHKVQLFTSLETGEAGEQRLGAIYQSKVNLPIGFTTLKNVALRSDVILNSQTAHCVENLNARAEVPFNLSPKHKHALTGAINVFAGYAGEFLSATNPNPSLNAVYGLGVRVNIADSKNYGKVQQR